MIKKLGRLAKLLSNHKGKALIGASLVPAAYLAWKKRDVIADGVRGLAGRAVPKKSASGLSDSRKTDLVNTVRFMLGRYDTAAFHIIYGRDRHAGYMGYHVRTDAAALFFGWTDALEEAYPMTPFWMVLDPAATRAFGEKNLKAHYDIYTNPADDRSIAIPAMPDMVDDPAAVAAHIIEIARKTLL